MKLFDKKYLSKGQIKGFDKYKYSCIDSSPIAVYISHPFWNWFVNFYPVWLAPNVLTLAGSLLVMGCYWFLAFLDYDFTANSVDSPPDRWIPQWVWFLAGMCTFWAHLLDGTDGKQARRTGASGPTGELFDHGLDSWATVPFTLTIFSLFGQGAFSIPPARLLYVLISVQLVFIVTHWEKYNTGVMFLSWAYDASQYGLAGFYFFAYFMGHKWFQFYLFSDFSFAQVFELSFHVCCVLSFIMSFYNMYISYFIDRTGKQPNVFEFLLPMLAPTILFTASVFWANHSPTDIIHQDPRLFCWVMGVVFSNIAVRLIVAQMSCTRAEILNPLLVVYLVLSGLSLYGLFGGWELAVFKLAGLLLTLAHVHYGVCLVRQLCDHFKIMPFCLDYLKRVTNKN